MTPDGSSYLDTSLVVRYLTQDPPEMAEQAAKVLEGTERLVLTDLVLMETAHVLGSVYQIPRDEIVEGLTQLTLRLNLETDPLPKPATLTALSLCRGSKRISFPDAFLWARAARHSAGRVFSFDQRFPAVGIEVTATRPRKEP